MNAVSLTAALIEFDSRNPSLSPGAPGESRGAHFLGEVLNGWGFAVELAEVTNGRPNLLARCGRKSGPSLMLNGHLDVVGTDGMTHAPFAPDLRDGRLYGRGSTDMKGGIAAMCVAAHEAVVHGIDGEILIAAVIDEEYDSLGTRALLASGVRADAAIVTEPTRLAVCPAHRGFAWAEVYVHGRAAHGSRYDVGVDAITHAGLLLAELDRTQREVLPRRTHPLLGRGSLHGSTIRGGIGISTYPDSCTVAIERRTIPGENTQTFVDELESAGHVERALHPSFEADIRITTAQGPSDVSVDAPVVQALCDALQAEQLPVAIEGMQAWTDAALLNEAGIPTICFGPGDLMLAHAAEEYISLQEIDAATRVLQRTILSWCNSR